jgi:hypothetical protein
LACLIFIPFLVYVRLQRRGTGLFRQLPKVILGVKFADGLEVAVKPERRQPTTTAA